jgi:hypothetical protein
MVSGPRRQPRSRAATSCSSRSPGAVAHAVVDHLEVVEVDEEHGEAAAGAVGPGERVAHPVVEHRPVGEVGELVVEGLVLELRRQRLPLLQRRPQHRLGAPQLPHGRLDLPDQAGHAHQHQQEQQRATGDDHRDVDALAAAGLDGEDGRRHQRRGGEGGQPGAGQSGPRGRGRVGERGHRRLQHRGAPQGVGHQPAGLDGTGRVVGAGEQQQRTSRVGRDQHQPAGGDQGEGAGAVAAADRQPDHQGEQQHVQGHVRHRQGALGDRQRHVVGVGCHQEDPGQHAQAGGDHGGVDQAGPVPARAAGAHHQREARDADQVGGHRQHRRQRVPARAADGHRGPDRAGREAYRLAGREQVERQPAGRLPQAWRCQRGHDGGQAQHDEGGRPQGGGGQVHVGDGEGEADAEVVPPGGGPHRRSH